MNNDDFNYKNMSKAELIALLMAQNNLINEKDEIINTKEKEIHQQEVKFNYENKKLERKVKQQRKTISRYKIATKFAQLLLQNVIKLIEEKDIILKQQICDKFGIKSDTYEIINDIKLNKDETLANEAEVILTSKKRGRKTGTKDGDKFNYDIIESETKTIDSDLQICDICGSSNLELAGKRTYQKIDYVPAKIKVTEYEIYTYRCKDCGSIIESKEYINCFDNESFLTPSLASFVVNNKYNYALPLYRQEQILSQLGAPISRQSLASYCIDIANKLKPLYNNMKKELLETYVGVLHADETTERVIIQDDGNKTRKKCYIWLYATSMCDKPIYIYEHQQSRESIHPSNFLKKYKGYLVCDDYAGYEEIDNVKLARCWFYAKKKYADLLKVLSDEQKKNSLALTLHNMISNFIDVNNKIEEKAKSSIEIEEKREEKVRPLVNEYFNLIKEKIDLVDKSSKLYKAMNYSLKNEEDLCRFFEDGCIPMTNNLAERGIKPFVILRKNALFSYTEKGSQSSVILMSIVQTAKSNLVKPDEYIKYVLERIDDIKTSKIEELLPWSEQIPETIKYSKKDIRK